MAISISEIHVLSGTYLHPGIMYTCFMIYMYIDVCKQYNPAPSCNLFI